MSAYICSDYHVSVLARYAARQQYLQPVDGRQWKDASEIFDILHRENHRSVEYRYKLVPSTKWEYGKLLTGDSHGLDRKPLDIIKACHCLEYQSCETPDYPQTLAYRLLKAIESAAIRNLPGYSEAEWELQEPQRAVIRASGPRSGKATAMKLEMENNGRTA